MQAKSVIAAAAVAFSFTFHGVGIASAGDLPSIQSLGAGSDYRAFMAAEVDPATRVEALRVLWRSKPRYNEVDDLSDYGAEVDRLPGRRLKGAELRAPGLLERVLPSNRRFGGKDLSALRRIWHSDPAYAGPDELNDYSDDLS